MKAVLAVGALLVLGASALGCNGLLGISILEQASQTDAGDAAASPGDGGNDAEPDADSGSDSNVDAEPAADAGPEADAGPDADDSAAPACVLSALTISAGTLNPAFAPKSLSYTVISSATSLGVPFTMTPTVPAGCSVAVSGTAAVSGEASAPTALGLMSPTAIDVAVTPTGGTATIHYALVVPPLQEAYVKASNAQATAGLGYAIALSSDGNTLAVSAYEESSAATGIDGDQSDTSAANAGAVYVFSRTGTTWTQQAYVKASNAQSGAYFGFAVALSSDGNTLAVGAYGESSGATGINGDQSDAGTGWLYAGAAYVFSRAGTIWTQQAYVKASNTRPDAFFGSAVALSSDGNTLAVGSLGESSDAMGIDGDQSDTSEQYAGAVYLFSRAGTTWTQRTYVKASNETGYFGISVALSSGGNTLAVGSRDSSAATGINGNPSTPPNLAQGSAGAVYVFTLSGTWAQQAYIKASNTRGDALFGGALALSSDGNTLAVGSNGEASAAKGVNGNQSDTSEQYAGAVYVFSRSGTTWTQQAYVKASNTRMGADFGFAVALSSDGNTLAVGSNHESSAATGINGNQSDTSAGNAGAVYVFSRKGMTSWTQQAYVKASNARGLGSFGSAVALSSDGNRLVVGSVGESSAATGIDGNQSDTSAAGAGAVYVLR